MAGRITQAGLLAISQPTAQPAKITQAALLSVQGPPVSASQISQAVLIVVTSNGKRVICLENVISLSCYNPCHSYGYSGLIIPHYS